MRLGLGLALISTRSTPFSPTSIPGLEFWVRADMGITLNGSDVSGWDDQSGTGDANKHLTQAVPSKQPLYNATDAAYNNRPTLSFTRADDQVLMSAVWSTAPTTSGTFFAVGNFGNTGVAEVMTCFTNGPANGELYIGGTDDLRYYQGANLLATGETTCSSKHVYCVERNGATSKIYQSALTALVTGDAGTNTLTRMLVGSNLEGASGSVFDGKVAEVISYNRILTAPERGQVMTYLGARYDKAIGP